MVGDSGKLTPRQRFTAALERRSPPGCVPHFELVFFLSMEAFGKMHPVSSTIISSSKLNYVSGVLCFR